MIRSLNLDSMFLPTAFTEIEFEMSPFSGGEWHIKLNKNIDYSRIDSVVITHRVRNGDDIMKILISKDALVRQGINHFDLIIPYAPYARQDRQCAPYESFSLKIFTQIINACQFDKVHVLDAHSDVTPALINNCVNHSNNQYVNEAYNDVLQDTEKTVILVSPDSGANKKSNKLFEELGRFKKMVKCDKKRSVVDGSISGFEVFSDHLNGENCMIVDDIADRGGTFLGLAQELKKKNAGNIYLFVTHAILPGESLDNLSKVFTKIYSTNSFKDHNDSRLIQYKISI